MTGRYGRKFATTNYDTGWGFLGRDPHPTEPISSDLYANIRRSKQSNLKILRRARGLTLEALSELTGISPSYLSRLEGGARRLNTDLLEKLSSVLACQPGDLLNSESTGFSGTNRAPTHPSVIEVAHLNRYEGKEQGVPPQKDLPVYTISTALGVLPDNMSQASTVDFSTPADWILRPPQLLGINKAFALYVGDDGYAPRYMSGDTLLVHTSRPLLPRSSLIVLTKDEHVLVRQFHGWCQDTILLSLFENVTNSDIQSIPKDDLKAVYKIIGTIEAI